MLTSGPEGTGLREEVEVDVRGLVLLAHTHTHLRKDR